MLLLFYLCALFWLEFALYTSNFAHLAHCSSTNDQLDSYDTFYINQLIDHTCGESCGTFSQRVIFNSSYAANKQKQGGTISSSPLLILVGGEYDIETWWEIMGAETGSLASSESAVVAALEHRYFGNSFPEQPPSLGNLSTLSPAIAAKDVYTALPLILIGLNLNIATTRIVLLGCSYSGTVAAYTQSTESIAGVYASSTPVQPEVEMESYHVTMAEAFADPAAGGSPQCSALITGALQNASSMMARGSFIELQDAWASCSPITELNDARFMFYNTVDIAFGSIYVQENTERFIPYVCYFLSYAVDGLGASPAEAWRQLLVNVTFAAASGCTPGGGTGDWNAYIAQIASPNATYVGSSSTRSDRQWWYLQCAHVGWMHTCTYNGHCPYASPGIDFDPLPVDWYAELCQGAFGLSINDTSLGVAALEPLASASMSSSNIFAINGDADPWHVISLLPPPTSTRILVGGSWHCADMGAPMNSDPQGLAAARLAVAAQVHIWFESNDGDNNNSKSNTSGLRVGAIIGIVIASVAIVALVVGYRVYKANKQNNTINYTELKKSLIDL